MDHITKIGLFAIGLDTYWAQFEGLYDRLCAYKDRIGKVITGHGSCLIDAGMVDTAQKAHDAAELFEKNDVGLVFIYISTYALSSTVLPVVQHSKAHVVLLNIQPVPAIDYDYLNGLGSRGKMTGEWLAHCQACSIPEIASVFNRAGIKYDIVTGYLGDTWTDMQITEWLDAAKVKSDMRYARMGLLGHYYGGMLDVYTDLTLQSSVFGTHVEQLEMCQLKELHDSISEQQINSKIAEFRRVFKVSPECSQHELERAARTSVALDMLVEKYSLDSLAYYYEGIDDYQDIVTSFIAGNTILTGKGIPVAGEYEVKNVQAMKIMSLMGAGGSFSEFYAMDFNDDIVMLGHDGPAHPNIAEGQVELVPLPVYHGKPGCGLSIQMSVKHGDVTILSVCEGRDGVFLLVAEGASVPGPVLQIGNTNSRYRFPISAREFMDRWSYAGPSHHCAIGTGHIAAKIEKLSRMLDLNLIRIC